MDGKVSPTIEIERDRLRLRFALLEKAEGLVVVTSPGAPFWAVVRMASRAVVDAESLNLDD
jgi:hypothetical protein